MLLAVARYVNTLEKYGVPAENRKIAVVMHRGSTPITLTNEAFRARNDGHDNPNIKLIQDLFGAFLGVHSSLVSSGPARSGSSGIRWAKLTSAPTRSKGAAEAVSPAPRLL